MASTVSRLQMGRPLIAARAIEETTIPETFVGQFIAPDFQVDAFEFDSPTFGSEQYQAEDDDAVGLRGEFKELSISEGVQTFSLFERGRKAMISRKEIQAANVANRQMKASGRGGDAQMDLRARYANVLRGSFLRRTEFLILKKATDSANYSAAHVAGGVGSLVAGPVNVRTDVDLQEKLMIVSQVIRSDMGPSPNTMIIGYGARFGLHLNPAVKADIGDNAPSKLVSEAWIKEWVGIPNVHFADAITQKTPKAKKLPIMDNFIWVGYVDPSPNSLAATFMRNFWMAYDSGQRADVNELEIGVERNLWLSYAEQSTAEIVGKDYGFLIPTVSTA